MTTNPHDGGAVQHVDVTGALPSSVRERDVDGGAKVISALQTHFVVVLVGSQRVSWVVSRQMAHVYLVSTANQHKGDGHRA